MESGYVPQRREDFYEMSKDEVTLMNLNLTLQKKYRAFIALCTAYAVSDCETQAFSLSTGFASKVCTICIVKLHHPSTFALCRYSFILIQ
jgi:hypothetical protein